MILTVVQKDLGILELSHSSSPLNQNIKRVKNKNPLSPKLGSQLQQVQNSVNMVVSTGLGPYCSSWMARGSIDGWKVDFPNNVPRG